MLRKTRTATLHRLLPQLKATVVGVGVLLSGVPSMAGDGAYRSLTSPEFGTGYQSLPQTKSEFGTYRSLSSNGTSLAPAVPMNMEAAYRSLSSSNINYAEPVNLASTAGYVDSAYASTIENSMSDGMYVSAPSLTQGAHDPVYAPVPMENSLAQPMHFQHGTPVVHQSTPSYAPQSYASQGMPCCVGCDRSYYLNYDALWVRRGGDDNFTLSQNALMGDFHYEFAGRYTIGQLFDCVDGVEGVYTGPLRWKRSSRLAGVPGQQSFLIPFAGRTATDVDAFNDAQTHVQAWNAQFQNFEFNRRWWAGDILSSLVGARVITYREQYGFDSLSNDGIGIGTYRRSVENFLLGFQVGGDMAFPLSQRLSIASKGKMALFANFNEGNSFVRNRGILINNVPSDDIDVAGIIESGSSFKYRILPGVAASAGYEFWYLAGVATIPEQSMQAVHTTMGRKISAQDDVFFHGGTASLEISF